jgi:hypothetical protein
VHEKEKREGEGEGHDGESAGFLSLVDALGKQLYLFALEEEEELRR